MEITEQELKNLHKLLGINGKAVLALDVIDSLPNVTLVKTLTYIFAKIQLKQVTP